jgi:hypothetical protein
MTDHVPAPEGVVDQDTVQAGEEYQYQSLDPDVDGPVTCRVKEIDTDAEAVRVVLEWPV